MLFYFFPLQTLEGNNPYFFYGLVMESNNIWKCHCSHMKLYVLMSILVQ